jgi:hypothetical protein
VRPLIADVVIDTFDYGRFLGAAIDIARSQTHAHTQVTVVDHGNRIRVITQANGGQASRP